MSTDCSVVITSTPGVCCDSKARALRHNVGRSLTTCQEAQSPNDAARCGTATPQLLVPVRTVCRGVRARAAGKWVCAYAHHPCRPKGSARLAQQHCLGTKAHSTQASGHAHGSAVTHAVQLCKAHTRSGTALLLPSDHWPQMILLSAAFAVPVCSM
jgi:hypothetical protein